MKHGLGGSDSIIICVLQSNLKKNQNVICLKSYLGSTDNNYYLKSRFYISKVCLLYTSDAADE